MKILITFSFLLFAAISVGAQQLHFAYLQTDTHKPFYIVLNKKNYSSTASGYVILPKLLNGDYPVRIGFAKNENPEQEYLLQVKDNDQGLLIKDFGDKGWGLFNMQTMAVQYAGTAAQEKAKLAAAEKLANDERQRKIAEETAAANTQRRNDSLKMVGIAQQQSADSAAAIAAANDVRQRNYADSVAKANNTAQQNIYNDSIAKSSTAAQQAIYNDSIANEKRVTAENIRLEKIADSTARALDAEREKQKEKHAIATKPAIKTQQIITPDSVPPHPADTNTRNQVPLLLQQTFTDSGWQYAYTISNTGQRETIYVFIPARKPVLPPVASTLPDVQKDSIIPVKAEIDSAKPENTNPAQDTLKSSQNVVSSDPSKTNNVIIAGNASTQQTNNKDSLTPKIEKPILNSNCRAVANEKDFLNARKKLAAADGTDNMIIATRKFLKEKCYTIDQLRNLSVLFLTDADRYQFLDVAYPFTFDSYRYSTLQDLLKDDYYVQRFKAMLH